MGRPIVPRLKRNKWWGVERNVCRPLINYRSSHVPWVALGSEDRPDFAYLTLAAFEQDPRSGQDLEAEAIRNVRLRDLQWTESTIGLGVFKKLTILNCQGDPLSAEKILDVGFMKLAHERLRADELLAGVPYNGVLSVIDARGGAERVETFGTLVVTEYAEAGKDYVSPALFSIQGGYIAGVDDSIANRRLPAVAHLVKDEIDPGLPEVTVAVGIPRGEEKEEIYVEAGGADAARLIEAVLKAVAASLNDTLRRPLFGGGVRVLILSAKTPVATRNKLQGLERQLQDFDVQAARLAPHCPLKVKVEVDGVPW